jgi:hypothetical protein
MPITRKQFYLGIDSEIEQWMRKIHPFLSEHKDEAFTVDELHQEHKSELAYEGESGLLSGAKLEVFDHALEKLVDLGAVAKRRIRNTDYYSYRGSLHI